jgi:outer membrane protein OmpA-like peptidoglycan-associated protein
MYIHGDFLWNMSNAFSGYKETRFWNLVPYVHTGFYRSYGQDGADFSDNEFALGAGLLHNLRLTNRLDLIIDMRATVVNGRVHQASGAAVAASVTAGLAVDLGFPGFVRTSSVMEAADIANAERFAVLEAAAIALEAANDALEVKNLQLEASNKNMKTEMDKLKKQKPKSADVADFLEGMSPTVYFEIGQTVLGPKELMHLEFIAENLVAKAVDSDRIVVTVMGTADSNTGTSARNKYLSEARGKYVFDILTQKYGFSPDKIVVQSEVIKAEHDPALDRSVTISF